VIAESVQRASLRFAHCRRGVSRQHQPLQYQAPGSGTHGGLIVTRIGVTLGDGETFAAFKQPLGVGRSQWLNLLATCSLALLLAWWLGFLGFAVVEVRTNSL
jgi:hypothetical protein